MKIEGQAVTGGTGQHGRGLPPIPENLHRPHRPWCGDCKKKFDATDLDQAGRCVACARAVVSRAEAAERRTAREAAEKAERERLAAEQRAATAAAPTPPNEEAGNPGVPTTRSSAPRATSPSSNPGSAPGAGSAATEENPSAGQEMRPVPADGLDPTIELRERAAKSTDRVVIALRKAAVSALDALAIVVDGAQTPAAPVRVRARKSGGVRRPALVVDEAAVIAAYQAGDTRPEIARAHGVLPKRITQILEAHHVELRDDRTTHSSGTPRVYDQVTVDDVVGRYTDGGQTIADIADALTIGRRQVARILREAGIDVRPPVHLDHTPMTEEEKTAAVRSYVNGEPLARVAAAHGVRVPTVRQLVLAAGYTIRTKGSSASKFQRLADLGVTSAEIKQWALDQGLIDEVRTGQIAGALIDAYEAAHRDQQVAS